MQISYLRGVLLRKIARFFRVCLNKIVQHDKSLLIQKPSGQATPTWQNKLAQEFDSVRRRTCHQGWRNGNRFALPRQDMAGERPIKIKYSHPPEFLRFAQRDVQCSVEWGPPTQDDSSSMGPYDKASTSRLCCVVPAASGGAVHLPFLFRARRLLCRESDVCGRGRFGSPCRHRFPFPQTPTPRGRAARMLQHVRRHPVTLTR